MSFPGEITGEANTDRLRILCVTYGSPKVGNSHFVNWMDDHEFLRKNPVDGLVRCKVLRVMDIMDPVPTLPPATEGFRFHHIIRRGAVIANDGVMYFVSKEVADKFDDSLRGADVLLTKGVENHDLILYLLNSLHFAWELDEKKKVTPIEKALGAPAYRYDQFTQQSTFLTDF